jgi:hypothetical protein
MAPKSPKTVEKKVEKRARAGIKERFKDQPGDTHEIVRFLRKQAHAPGGLAR